MNEEFPDQQKPIPLFLAQRENRKRKGFQGGKHSREDHPYLWKRTSVADYGSL